MNSENELANSENEMEIDLSEYAAPQKNRLTERRNAVVGNGIILVLLSSHTYYHQYDYSCLLFLVETQCFYNPFFYSI